MSEKYTCQNCKGKFSEGTCCSFGDKCVACWDCVCPDCHCCKDMHCHCNSEEDEESSEE